MTQRIFLGLALLLTACGGTPSAPPVSSRDTQAPDVSVHAPSAFTTADTITVNASATDNVDVTAVEFYLDDVLQKRLTTRPYQLVLGKLAPGMHKLYAKAFDQEGNVASSKTVTFTVFSSLNGKIEKDITLTADQSPYIVTDGLIVAPGVTLTVNPGVQVNGSPTFGGLTGITVHGTLRAIGTSTQPVTFNSVRLDPSATVVNGTALTTFKHAIITDTQFFTLIVSPGGVSNLKIEDSLIEYTPDFKRTNSIGSFAGGSVFLKGNVIRGATLEFSGDNEYINNYITGDGVLVYFNDTTPEFFNNTVIGKQNSVVTARPLTGERLTISVPMNYWGTTDPNVIEDMILDGKDDYGQRATVQLQGILNESHSDTPKP